ncbi:hypothetical protein ACQP2F_41780 [Actinoplanes sp. CA-030573]|uniref:hypothetical protein n=1 Tax=Actinoplanes sp. CA-030573 TaxID=3239898 RepID=UPI003D8FDF37
MKLNYRKPAVAAAIVAGVLAVSGTAAYAYWTAQGTGTGTAGTAAAGQALTITQDSFNGSALTPGGAAQAISGTVANANTFNVPFTLTAAPTVDSAHATAGCLASWYTVTLTTPPTSVAAGNHADFAGTVAMTNLPNDNQDSCKGATVTITYTAKSV